MKVLFCNHTGEVSGAEHSLLDLLDGMRRAGLETRLVCGGDGPLPARARALGTEAEVVKPFTAGFTRNPLQLSRYAAQLWEGARRVAAIARDWKADVIHANSVRAGLVASAVRNFHRAPLVVHIRDCVPLNALGALARRLIGSRAAAIIANSAYTGQSFAGESGGIRERIRVVYNPVDLTRFDPVKVDATPLRHELALDGAFPVLALVAQITPWKGQRDAIAAVSQMIQSLPKVKLLIVGEAKFRRAAARYDNAAYARALRELVSRHGLSERVLFTGERDDIPAVFKACDIALLPSWEEPFGRTIVEAMAMGKPVVATCVGGPAEVMVDGGWRGAQGETQIANCALNEGLGRRTPSPEPPTGVLVPPRTSEALAEAVVWLAEHPQEAEAMGKAGRERAERLFTLESHVRQVVSVYVEALGRERGDRQRVKSG